MFLRSGDFFYPLDSNRKKIHKLKKKHSASSQQVTGEGWLGATKVNYKSVPVYMHLK